MGTIYKSAQSERVVKELYDRQVQSLNKPYKDLYVDTRYGKTHVLQVGNPSGEPMLLFHGGNSTAPFSLLKIGSLISDRLIYVADTIGHPGKSDQVVLPSGTLAYGEWASDVIDALGFGKTTCMGESFGGGILAKLMCVAPEKIDRAIMLVPAGIYNAPKTNLVVSMGVPMMLYLLTKKETWFEKTFKPMTSPGEPMDQETLDMIRMSFLHVKVNADMPSEVAASDIKGYKAPTLIIAAEKDALFPGDKVIARAKEIMPQAKTHLLKGCGHLYYSSQERNEYIRSLIHGFLNRQV